MLPLVWSFFIFLIGVYGQGGPEEPEEQKWVAVLQSPLTVCEDDLSLMFMDTSEVGCGLYNESTSVCHGPMNFSQSMSETYTAELKLEKQANGKSEVVLTTCIHVCSEMLDLEGDFYFILKHFEVGGKCPFPAGVYLLNGMIVDLSGCPINSGNAGCYKATISIFDGPCDDKDKPFVACVHIGFCIEPE